MLLAAASVELFRSGLSNVELLDRIEGTAGHPVASEGGPSGLCAAVAALCRAVVVHACGDATEGGTSSHSVKRTAPLPLRLLRSEVLSNGMKDACAVLDSMIFPASARGTPTSHLAAATPAIVWPKALLSDPLRRIQTVPPSCRRGLALALYLAAALVSRSPPRAEDRDCSSVCAEERLSNACCSLLVCAEEVAPSAVDVLELCSAAVVFSVQVGGDDDFGVRMGAKLLAIGVSAASALLAPSLVGCGSATARSNGGRGGPFGVAVVLRELQRSFAFPRQSDVFDSALVPWPLLEEADVAAPRGGDVESRVDEAASTASAICGVLSLPLSAAFNCLRLATGALATASLHPHQSLRIAVAVAAAVAATDVDSLYVRGQGGRGCDWLARDSSGVSAVSTEGPSAVESLLGPCQGFVVAPPSLPLTAAVSIVATAERCVYDFLVAEGSYAEAQRRLRHDPLLPSHTGGGGGGSVAVVHATLLLCSTMVASRGSGWLRTSLHAAATVAAAQLAVACDRACPSVSTSTPRRHVQPMFNPLSRPTIGSTPAPEGGFTRMLATKFRNATSMLHGTRAATVPLDASLVAAVGLLSAAVSIAVHPSPHTTATRDVFVMQGCLAYAGAHALHHAVTALQGARKGALTVSGETAQLLRSLGGRASGSGGVDVERSITQLQRTCAQWFEAAERVFNEGVGLGGGDLPVYMCREWAAAAIST